MNNISAAKIILRRALPDISFYGWKISTLKSATKACEIGEEYVEIAFPNGVVDAIDLFINIADEEMSSIADSEEFRKKSIPQKIEFLILERLRSLTPHKEAVRRAVFLYSMPWNFVRASGATFRTVDEIWKLAQISDFDYNWYTRRATLAYVYTTTLKFWLAETDMEQVESFLKRRLTEVAKIGKIKKLFKQA